MFKRAKPPSKKQFPLPFGKEGCLKSHSEERSDEESGAVRHFTMLRMTIKGHF